MPKPQLVGPRPGTTPSLTISRGQLTAIPPDLLRAASRRLGVMSLLGAVLWVIGTAAYHIAELKMLKGDPRWLAPDGTDGIAAVSIAASIALFFYTRREEQNPRFVLDLGLAYLVITSLAIGLVFHWDVMPAHVPMGPMITWIGPVLLMFAAIVPTTPSKMLAAGLLSAAMNPVAMLIARARGTWNFSSSSDVLLMHYPDFVLVGVAVLISHVVTKLGRQVTEAREMGSYQLLSLLGKGGMGEVWLARHRMLARDAAIKLIQPHMLSNASGKNADMMQRRFEQEARTTASLRSPHTVELYDFGVTEDGVFYYVMELLNGIDLETLVKEFGPQPPARVSHILRQVCRSLSEAHRHGMIHRDIKPTNIYLCRMGDEYDFAKVLDFGLVKVLDENAGQVTVDGATTGTPAYMAPELAMGSTNLDGRCDLYGLGCVAYWLLTGGLVFQESSATAMMVAHVNKAPLPPSKRSELDIPACLDEAILMCLAKTPAGRPASAGHLAQMLGKCRQAGSWTRDDAEQWWKTNAPEKEAHPGPGAYSDGTETV